MVKDIHRGKTSNCGVARKRPKGVRLSQIVLLNHNLRRSTLPTMLSCVSTVTAVYRGSILGNRISARCLGCQPSNRRLMPTGQVKYAFEMTPWNRRAPSLPSTTGRALHEPQLSRPSGLVAYAIEELLLLSDALARLRFADEATLPSKHRPQRDCDNAGSFANPWAMQALIRRWRALQRACKSDLSPKVGK